MNTLVVELDSMGQHFTVSSKKIITPAEAIDSALYDDYDWRALITSEEKSSDGN